MVNGHWHKDVDGLKVFEPTSTIEQKASAITQAGTPHYSQWLQRFVDRGLLVHVSLGDHEVGDNDWLPG